MNYENAHKPLIDNVDIIKTIVAAEEGSCNFECWECDNFWCGLRND